MIALEHPDIQYIPEQPGWLKSVREVGGRALRAAIDAAAGPFAKSHGKHHHGRASSPVETIQGHLDAERELASQVGEYQRRWGSEHLPLTTHANDGPPPPLGINFAPTEMSKYTPPKTEATTAPLAKQLIHDKPEATELAYQLDPDLKEDYAMSDQEFAELVRANQNLEPAAMVAVYQSRHGATVTDIQGERANLPLFTHGIDIVEPAAQRRIHDPDTPPRHKKPDF